VGFVVDKVALGQVFSEYLDFPCQSSFHQLLHNHPHLSSGAGTIGQKWPQYKGLSPTQLAIKKIRFNIIIPNLGISVFDYATDLYTEFLAKIVHSSLLVFLLFVLA
jgi:hypothetical protein